MSLAQTPAGTPDCPWWLWFTGNYLACTQQPQLRTEANAQIQGVVDNAALYYGPTAAQVAQQAADAQMANTPLDVASATQTIEDSQDSQSPLTYAGNYLLNPNANNNSNQNLWGLPVWAWVGIFFGGGLLVVKAMK